jgi:hypothetical protein
MGDSIRYICGRAVPSRISMELGFMRKVRLESPTVAHLSAEMLEVSVHVKLNVSTQIPKFSIIFAKDDNTAMLAA